MRKNVMLGIMLTLLLIGMLTLAFNIQPLKSEWTGTVYIRADGSIDPPSAPITTCDSITYILTGNLTSDEDGIVIERENIILDGNGYLLRGNGSGCGVHLFSVNNVTIKNLNIKNFYNGILIDSSSYNTIYGNNVTNNEAGVHLIHFLKHVCSENLIVNNFIASNTLGLSIDTTGNRVAENVIYSNEMGMYISAGNNTLISNVMIDNIFGIYLESSNNILRDNQLLGNHYNFISSLLPGTQAPHNDVDVSNTVDGKPIYYLVNQTNLDINPSSFPDVGYLAFLNCSNITVKNLTLTNNGQGILLSQCINCTIEGNTIKDNLIAISAYTNNASFSNNIISENYHGITLIGYHNRIENNTIMNNTVRLAPYRWPDNWPRNNPVLRWITQYGLMWYSGGMYLWHTFNSTIINNNMTNNEHGILLYGSGFNIFKNNSMANNVYNFGIDTSRLFPPEWLINLPKPPQISPYLLNDVDASNTVNEKPIYWWINRRNEQVPMDAGYVILVNSTNMIVNNLVLQNNAQGMLLVNVNNTIVSNNTIRDNMYGILIRRTIYEHESVNNTVTYNNITKNGAGIYLIAKNCTISNNVIAFNLAGIYDRGEFNVIIKNTIENNTSPPKEEWLLGQYKPPHSIQMLYYLWGWPAGIILECFNTTICYNTLQNNEFGINTVSKFISRREGNNRIYHNNFIDNIHQAAIGYGDKWDSGYPLGGNYWSDYNGTDIYFGQEQNQTGSDGIGDVPYPVGKWVVTPRGGIVPPEVWEISVNQNDSYPLAAPINIFDVGSWNNISCQVDIISNSTISNFQFNKTEKIISFNVTSEAGLGFCRVTIPNIIVHDLWHNNYTVLVDENQPLSIRNWTDHTNTYIYLAYQRPEYKITITPEFPSTTILTLFTLTTLIATILLKKKRKPKLNFPKFFVLCHTAYALAYSMNVMRTSSLSSIPSLGKMPGWISVLNSDSSFTTFLSTGNGCLS